MPKVRYDFPTSCRLLKTKQFHRVFSQKKCSHGRYYLVCYRKNDNIGPRLGVIASKRSIAKATDRNRVRRLVKEAFRLSKHQLQSLDLVIIAKKTAINASNVELHKCLSKLLKKFHS